MTPCIVAICQHSHCHLWKLRQLVMLIQEGQHRLIIRRGIDFSMVCGASAISL